jgi:NADH-quinone oxidoreductase subunit A
MSSATIADGREAPTWRFVGMPSARRRCAIRLEDRSIGRGEAPVELATFGRDWFVILLMTGAAFLMGMTLLSLNLIMAPSKPTAIKSAPYESGMPGVVPVRPRYTPRFYVVAMLFVIFDIEAVFMFPWAVIFDQLGRYGFVEMLVFIGLLFVGYIYAWKKGALEWV